MTYSKVFGALAAILMCTAASAGPDDRRYGNGPSEDSVHFAWADVLRVDPVYDYVRNARPERECYDEHVTRHESGSKGGATVLGALIGGALGNQVGKGDGRKAATIAGAVVGGAIGHDAGREGRTYTDTETRCRTVDNGYEERRIVGYDVEYRYRGDTYMSRLNYDPGERIRVRVSVAPAE